MSVDLISVLADGLGLYVAHNVQRVERNRVFFSLEKRNLDGESLTVIFIYPIGTHRKSQTPGSAQ